MDDELLFTAEERTAWRELVTDAMKAWWRAAILSIDIKPILLKHFLRVADAERDRYDTEEELDARVVKLLESNASSPA